jgi:ABC-type sugar transport system ATPase subunit
MDNIIELRGIKKSFSGVEVLHGVDFELRRGEVLGLVGENGAGKSTLMSIIMGSKARDSGDIIINGEKQKDYGISIALEKGITIIPQELALVPTVTVSENIMLSQRPTRAVRLINWKKLHEEALKHLTDMGFQINPYARLDSLPIAYRQIVAIVKAISEKKQVIIMDEPTSSLSHDEVMHLHNVIRELKKRGNTIIYISHLLEEVFNITDRITVMRDGNIIDTKITKETNEREIVSMMVGEELFNVQQELLSKGSQEKKAAAKDAEVILKVSGLKRKHNSDELSFELRKGEILGITGLVGSGKTEMARNIFGLDKYAAGSIEINGCKVNISSPRQAIKNRLMLVPEDRKLQGLVLPMTVLENITLGDPYRKKVGQLGFSNKTAERRDAAQYVRKLKIRIARMEQRVRNLSGGNQQKVVLSKALLIQPEILILDEPTRGIDVGAKAIIYQLIEKLKQEGMAILFLSSDFNEVPLISDRLLVMRDGRIVTELNGEEITIKNIVNHVAGVKDNE